ncbi:dienelactone hydrolase family protein [Comamonas sp. Y33R10-2]|uniref:alpha/beta hydrolase n=1 Tax=Comamonas sp. Y33R10-2 TaxID=2853257 RepID=UPI001C5C9118|nr:dienelactone hydrolase family protein [Comamonas sp. Y33R10-2]QXZ08353.1 dienelactone hydrolase family protein [Comamonas sp. Y33R10-2]
MNTLPLTYLERPAQAAQGQPVWLLVLMHGVGSNEQDLFGLAPYVPPQFHVISLRAPFAMGMGAYAWFQFTVDADGTRHINVPQEQQARTLVQQTVEQAAAQLNIPPERVVVGGFSQGGIMSLSQLLTQPQTLRAALIWHSRLLPEIAAQHAPAAAFAGKSAWVSHGTYDNVIPLTSAHAIRDKLGALPLQLNYHEYPGAHEIRPEELKASMQWLQDLSQLVQDYDADQ